MIDFLGDKSNAQEAFKLGLTQTNPATAQPSPTPSEPDPQKPKSKTKINNPDSDAQ